MGHTKVESRSPLGLIRNVRGHGVIVDSIRL